MELPSGIVQNLACACKDNPTDKWGIIRSIYKKELPRIMECERKGRGVDPYFLDWYGSFTPIEQIVWNDIRCYGGRFYPQFPALKYFIDFANPFLKIGIEVDGAQWHDINRDRERDQHLIKDGWKIFRIKGREAFASKEPPCLDEYEYEDFKREAMSEWFMETSEGVIAAIREIYFYSYGHYRDICIETLDAHRIIDFPLEAE